MLTTAQLASQNAARSALSTGIALSTINSVQDTMVGTTKHPVQLRIVNTDPTNTYIGSVNANNALPSTNIATTGLNKLVGGDTALTGT